MRHLKKFEDISADDLFLQHTNDFARDKQVITNQDDDNVNDEENSDIDEKPWGDEDDSSLNYSDKSKNSISSFNDFDCDSCDNDETDEYNPENDDDFGAIRADGSDNLGYDNDEEEEEEDDKPWDENIKLERFSTFNEKKKAAKKDEDKDSKKPDFKDFDGDGDKKEPMTKALKDKEDKEDKEDKGGKKFEKPKKGEIPAALKKYQDKKKKK